MKIENVHFVSIKKIICRSYENTICNRNIDFKTDSKKKKSESKLTLFNQVFEKKKK